MSDHEFLFSLQLSDEAYFEQMLSDLAGAVLTYVGYAPPASDEMRRVLREALAAGAAHGGERCQVRFRAHGGELQLAVEYADGVEWHTTRALP